MLNLQSLAGIALNKSMKLGYEKVEAQLGRTEYQQQSQHVVERKASHDGGFHHPKLPADNISVIPSGWPIATWLLDQSCPPFETVRKRRKKMRDIYTLACFR